VQSFGFGKTHEIIYFYTKSDQSKHQTIYMTPDEAYIEKYFTRDINRHVVQIDRTVIDNSGYGESIIDDLKLISKCIQNRESYIDVDSESMLDALSSYYHAEPNMPELFDINKFNK